MYSQHDISLFRPSRPFDSGSSSTVDLISAGQFIQALCQPELQILLGAHGTAEVSGPEGYFSWVRKRLLEQHALAAELEDKPPPILQTMLLGAVLCVNMFVQQNLTG